MDLIYKLTKMFRGFPGIGERQAKRFVYYLLNEDEKKLKELAATILELKKEVSQCRSCFRFSGGKNEICDLCRAAKEKKVLIVVEKDADLEVFRKADFDGKFFVLGGTIPVLEKEIPKNIKLKELLDKLGKENIEEVILAFSLTPLGEHTLEYVKKAVAAVAKEKNIKISGLGRGLSSGLELEYSDSETLLGALKNRY
ncbi:MAG TPA: toprim domain-containing protein [Candidatus Paceibacterota bacterium]|nr:toprim domain-containing protein [Candidatus Paceibacterota bacterium]